MAAEEAAERAESCNVPLQVGVGLAGGAEVAIQLLREHLRRHPSHAIASDDKRNGFNCIPRKAIFSGLRRWFPDLIPTVALWYSKRRLLFLFNDEARDGSGDIWCCTQGHFMVRDTCAQLAGMDVSKLRVTASEIGGGFGGKTTVFIEPVALVLSRKAGRPVKLVMSRDEVFLATGRPRPARSGSKWAAPPTAASPRQRRS